MFLFQKPSLVFYPTPDIFLSTYIYLIVYDIIGYHIYMQ